METVHHHVTKHGVILPPSIHIQYMHSFAMHLKFCLFKWEIKSCNVCSVVGGGIVCSGAEEERGGKFIQ